MSVLFVEQGQTIQYTIVFLRATLAPLALTLAKETLPKLPSPISLITSNRSSNAVREYEDALLL